MGLRDWLTRRRADDFVPAGASHSFLFGPMSSDKQMEKVNEHQDQEQDQ